MANIISTIVVDLVANTVTLTATQGVHTIGKITYSSPSNQITFAARAAISLDKIDFINLMNQVPIFQNVISSNFPFNNNSAIPFSSMDCVENNNLVSHAWTIVCIVGSTPDLINYSASSVTQLVTLAHRAADKTIEFPEWKYVMYCLNHYKNSINYFLT